MKRRNAMLAALFGGILAAGSALAAEDASKVTAEAALKHLLDGNQRYVQQQMTGVRLCDVSARQKLAGGQAPVAIILSCSDSRVPPELIFDEGLGEIFVVRVAGNVVDPIVLGSVEYAAEHLGTPLVMVLGHERCGAVKATVESHGEGHGNIGAIVKAIAPALKSAKKSEDKAQYVEAVVAANVARVKERLTADSKVLEELVHAGKLKIVTAKYDIDDGIVTVLEGL